MLNTYFKLKTFQLIYNHTEIYEWISSNIFTNDYDDDNASSTVVKPLSLILPTSTGEPFRRNNKHENVMAFEWLMKNIIIKGCAELWNISMLTKLNEQTASISVSHVKLLLQQYDDKRSSIYHNRFANLLLNNRHWSTELMVESLWCALGGASRDTNNLKKIHTRGSPLFMLVSLVKLSSYGSATKLDFSVHTLRTEYSSCLAEFILTLQECWQQYGLQKRRRSSVLLLSQQQQQQQQQREIDKLSNQEATTTTYPIIIVNAKITDVTGFFFNNYETCVLLSLSEVTLERTQQIAVLKISGLQTAILCPNNDPLMSLNDFTDVFSNIKAIRIEYMKSSLTSDIPHVTIYILDDTEAMWNCKLHMHIVTLFRDMIDFKTKFHHASTTTRSEITNEPTSNASSSSSSVKSSLPPIVLDVYAEGNTVFGIKISERHSMQLFLQNVYVSRKKQMAISMENIFLNIDEMHIFTIKDLDIQSMASIDVLRAERRNYENFVCATNSVWVTMIGEFKGIFPYDHDFADAIQNEFNSMFKWLKSVHQVKKKPFTVASTLPSDMIIQVKEFLLELSDDPFEVKLRDNYVLLVDEYHESLKRKHLFDQKIRELCSERLLLPAGTLEELYANLVKKNSEIYIQRSKKINESGPPRTRLFAWILTDLQIMAMADPSIHGKDNVTAMMREIDVDSPWPEEGLDFVTLWCRAINVSCSEWKFMLR